MFCQADQREVDAKLNPTVRNKDADPILLYPLGYLSKVKRHFCNTHIRGSRLAVFISFI